MINRIYQYKGKLYNPYKDAPIEGDVGNAHQLFLELSKDGLVEVREIYYIKGQPILGHDIDSLADLFDQRAGALGLEPELFYAPNSRVRVKTLGEMLLTNPVMEDGDVVLAEGMLFNHLMRSFCNEPATVTKCIAHNPHFEYVLSFDDATLNQLSKKWVFIDEMIVPLTTPVADGAEEKERQQLALERGNRNRDPAVGDRVFTYILDKGEQGLHYLIASGIVTKIALIDEGDTTLYNLGGSGDDLWVPRSKCFTFLSDAQCAAISALDDYKDIYNDIYKDNGEQRTSVSPLCISL